MNPFRLPTLAAVSAAGMLSSALAQESPRPYRLEAVDLNQPVLWSAEIRLPDGTGLAFGGQDPASDDGRPHTRVLAGGEWKRIDAELRANNPLQPLHDRIWVLRNEAKDSLAKARRLFFKGLPDGEQDARWWRDHKPALAGLAGLSLSFSDVLRELPAEPEPLAAFVRRNLDASRAALKEIRPTPEGLKSLHDVQILLELAAEAAGAEPPPRALDCGPKADTPPAAPPRALVYEPATQRYVLFGGDHLDYLTNDLWLFDPAIPRWTKQYPALSPPPRANHRLTAPGDGTLRMSGGYTYASNTDYMGGQYVDLDDGEWIYDLENSTWTRADGGAVRPCEPRTYRDGALHPDYFYGGERPDAAAFEAVLRDLPVNEWVATNPPFRPSLNRDWGTARLDPDRDLILRWSGGHSAHGGTDVPHFHLSTNRWELPFPVEFPLGQLYANTSYPDGFNFNLRPWVTGHTYQSYAYDLPSKTMVFAGRPGHFYTYDPDKADWTSRGAKPKAMSYGDCFYTLTLASTPRGVLCWDQNGAIHLFDAGKQTWNLLETTGAELPGAHVDHSSIVYDSKRNRVLIANTPGYQKPYTGQIWALSLNTNTVEALHPAGMERAHHFANIDRSCYDPVNDLFLIGTFLKDRGARTPQPAYDCAHNRWITLDLHYGIGERNDRTQRLFPHEHSDALMADDKRKLIWGLDTHGQVYVLRLNLASANPLPL